MKVAHFPQLRKQGNAQGTSSKMLLTNLSISDSFLEVIGVTPQEPLKVFWSGIAPYILTATRKTIDEQSINTSTKHFVNCQQMLLWHKRFPRKKQ
jgi:hypothetical protein